MDKNLAISHQSKDKVTLKHLLVILGPGILFAGAAVGGSHLVQSTRAGALFGYQLLPLILLINLLKYPFFEFSQRYTLQTGKNLLQGYYSLHRLALLLFFAVTIISSFITIAAVSFISANLLSYTLHGLLSQKSALALTLLTTSLILFLGKYRLLDRFIKILMVLLTTAVVLASIMTFTQTNTASSLPTNTPLWTLSSISFMIALMGWMPTPLDGSVWTSLWLQEKIAQQNYRPKLRDVLIDLRVGYVLTTLLAILFLSLGAEIMHRAGIQFSANGIKFSEQLIDLFGLSLGQWSEVIISIAALATMFSTTLTCLDAYPRTLTKCMVLLRQKTGYWEGWLYWLLLGNLALVSFIISLFFEQNLKKLIDLATITAFLAAPIVGYLNIKLIKSDQSLTPSKFLMNLSYIGLGFLTVVSVVYILLLII